MTIDRDHRPWDGLEIFEEPHPDPQATPSRPISTVVLVYRGESWAIRYPTFRLELLAASFDRLTDSPASPFYASGMLLPAFRQIAQATLSKLPTPRPQP